MAISSYWLNSGGLFGFDPLILFCVENAQLAVVFLPVVAPEDVKLFVVKRGSVVLDLRGAQNRLVLRLLVVLIDC